MGSDSTSAPARLAGMAQAVRALASTRDPARLRPQAASSARLATGARAGLVVLRHARMGPSMFADGTPVEALPPSTEVIAAMDGTTGWWPGAGPDSLVSAPLPDGRGWLCAIDRATPFDAADRDALAALATQLAAAEAVAEQQRKAQGTESRYRALVEQIPAVTYYRAVDEPGQPFFVSPQVEELIGYSAAELVAEPDLWRERLHPDDRATVLEQQATFQPGNERRPVSSEYRMVHRAGHTVWVRNYALAVRDEDGAPRFVLGVMFDVTASKQAEAARLTSEAKLRHVADANLVGIFTADGDGRIIEANDAFLAMIGHRADAITAGALRWEQLSPPEWRQTDQRALAELREHGRTAAVEKQYLRKDGARVPVLVGAARVPGAAEEYVAFVLDLSERKRLEERLRQSQKMDAIGQLAGGVAHDFNNVLSVILTYGELLTRQLRPGDPIRGDVEEIIAAGERAKSLTRQLLAFSRRQVLQPRVGDLGEVIGGLEAMLRRLLGEDVALDVMRSAEACRALVDPTQIEQVILNLAVNARDAMPEGGHLSIRVDSARLARPRDDGLDLPDGDYVRLTVSDTGVGMDEATRARMFEPFFTTKPMGQGTGLGLSTVFGIVEQSGGAIAVRSAPGQGTAIAIHLPRTEAPTQTTQPIPVVKLRGDETILLVEDDDPLRRLTRVALQHHGYQVLEAANGGEALLLCEQHAGPIHLLLTDVVLPRMSGRQLADRLLPLRAGMKVLYMTGYTDDAVVRHKVESREVALLQKPFSADELLGRVRRVLDGR